MAISFSALQVNRRTRKPDGRSELLQMSSRTKRAIIIGVGYLALHVAFVLITDNLVWFGHPIRELFVSMFVVISWPGEIVAFFSVILLIYRNIHDYSQWVFEGVSALVNGLLYGYLMGIMIPKLITRIRMKVASVSRP